MKLQSPNWPTLSVVIAFCAFLYLVHNEESKLNRENRNLHDELIQTKIANQSLQHDKEDLVQQVATLDSKNNEGAKIDPQYRIPSVNRKNQIEQSETPKLASNQDNVKANNPQVPNPPSKTDPEEKSLATNSRFGATNDDLSLKYDNSDRKMVLWGTRSQDYKSMMLIDDSQDNNSNHRNEFIEQTPGYFENQIAAFFYIPASIDISKYKYFNFSADWAKDLSMHVQEDISKLQHPQLPPGQRRLDRSVQTTHLPSNGQGVFTFAPEIISSSSTVQYEFSLTKPFQQGWAYYTTSSDVAPLIGEDVFYCNIADNKNQQAANWWPDAATPNSKYIEFLGNDVSEKLPKNIINGQWYGGKWLIISKDLYSAHAFIYDGKMYLSEALMRRIAQEKKTSIDKLMFCTSIWNNFEPQPIKLVIPNPQK